MYSTQSLGSSSLGGLSSTKQLSTTLNESVSLGDVYIRNVYSVLNEVLSPLENLTRDTTLKVMSEAISITQNIARSTSKSFVATFTIVSSYIRNIYAIYSQNINIVTIQSQKANSKNIMQSIGINDQLTILAVYVANFLESLTPAEILSSNITGRILVEVITLVENIASIITRIIANTINVVVLVTSKVTRIFSEIISNADLLY